MCLFNAPMFLVQSNEEKRDKKILCADLCEVLIFFVSYSAQ